MVTHGQKLEESRIHGSFRLKITSLRLLELPEPFSIIKIVMVSSQLLVKFMRQNTLTLFCKIRISATTVRIRCLTRFKVHYLALNIYVIAPIEKVIRVCRK